MGPCSQGGAGRRRGTAAAALLQAVALACLPGAARAGQQQDARAPGARREFATRYESATPLRVQVELGLELGDREVWILAEGAEPERAAGGALRLGREARKLAWLDRWLAIDEAGRLHVRRSFERLDATTTARSGAAERTEALRSPLQERTLEFVREAGGALQVQILGAPLGAAPRDPATLLEGREPTLGLDALLPAGAVAPGSVWTLSDADLRRALAPLVCDQATFPLSTPQPSGAIPMTAYVYVPQRLMQALTWSGEAKLAPAPIRWRAAECAAIELRVQAAFEIEAGPAPGHATVSGKGRLLFDGSAGRPVLLTLEGDLEVERTHGGQDPADPTRRRVTSRGRFDLTIEVFAAPEAGGER